MSDTTPAVCWFLTTAFLIVSIWGIVSSLFVFGAPLQIAMHAMVGWWLSVIGITTILGAIGLLNFTWLGGMAVIESLVLLAFERWGSVGKRIFRPCPLESIPESDRTSWLSNLAWWGVACFGAAFVLLNGLFVFPKDWDSLAYHIPLVDQWLLAQSLYAPHGSHWSHPGNYELLGLWAVAPFSGDFVIALANLPVVLLLVGHLSRL